MTKEIKKSSAPLSDAALEDVSGGRTLEFKRNSQTLPTCPICGGNLYPQKDENYYYQVCSACGYSVKTGQHS